MTNQVHPTHQFSELIESRQERGLPVLEDFYRIRQRQLSHDAKFGIYRAYNAIMNNVLTTATRQLPATGKRVAIVGPVPTRPFAYGWCRDGEIVVNPVLNRKQSEKGKSMQKVYQEDPLLLLVEAMASGVDGVIERSEARGQQSFVTSDTLPKKMIGCKREQLEEMGIVFGDDADDLFIYCQLPDGWSKQRTDHNMWSSLVDEKGRKRASVFYKAAFYDRDAHIHLERRYNLSIEPVTGWSSDYENSEWQCVAMDGDDVIWKSHTIPAEPKYSGDDDNNRQVWLGWLSDKDSLGALGQQWLFENFPHWKDPNAYWD